MNFDVVLKDLLLPLCQYPDQLSVNQVVSEDEKSLTLTICAQKNDIGHLIGKKGAMAQAIRSMMATASVLGDIRISIKFENNEENQ